jgi:hypothetical protein
MVLIRSRNRNRNLLKVGTETVTYSYGSSTLHQIWHLDLKCWIWIAGSTYLPVPEGPSTTTILELSLITGTYLPVLRIRIRDPVPF